MAAATLLAHIVAACVCREDQETPRCWAGPCPSIIRVLKIWRARHRQRRELAMMSERDLADLGLSRDRAMWETARWFWRDWSPHWNDTRAEQSEYDDSRGR